MTLLEIDQSGQVTRLAGEAQVALRRGDTEQSRSLCRQAGQELERVATSQRKQADKALTWFLAATQYYHGGLYAEAGRLCDRIQKNLLTPHDRQLYERFLKDVRDRQRPDYPGRIRARLSDLLAQEGYEAILDTLKEHHYVLPRVEMAFVRAVCCEKMGDFPAAALFHADAIRFSPEDPQLMVLSASYTLSLIASRELDRANAYVEQLLKWLPHALTYANASVLRYQQARVRPPDHARPLIDEQLRFIDTAREKFKDLPPGVSENREVRKPLVLGLQAAALTHKALGRREQMQEVIDSAVELLPDVPEPRMVRGLVTFPTESAIADLQEAIQLGGGSPFPFILLARAALERGENEAAVSWCQRGLRDINDRCTEARLLELLAIANARLGAQEEADQLFARARGLDPTNLRIRHNAEAFAAQQRNGAAAPAFEFGTPESEGEAFLARQARSFPSSRSHDRLQAMFLAS